MMAWIAVEDRLPEHRTWVLGVTVHGSYVIAANNSETGHFWSDQQGYTVYLSHWTPLPPLPPEPPR